MLTFISTTCLLSAIIMLLVISLARTDSAFVFKVIPFIITCLLLSCIAIDMNYVEYKSSAFINTICLLTAFYFIFIACFSSGGNFIFKFISKFSTLALSITLVVCVLSNLGYISFN